LCSSAVRSGEGSPIETVHVLLEKFGLSRGLVGDPKGRERFIRAEAARLTQQVQARTTRPVIKSIYIDVFGFSRGAAQARVFVNWLHRLMLSNGKLFGAHSYVRMLGIFDTVSSVGRTDAFGGSGHSGWALAPDLAIHPEVKKCVHFVAMHEYRSNFPVDSIAVGPNAEIPHPEKFFERFYPGAHSDVGGGYAPGEQGKGVQLVRLDPYTQEWVADDASKLSQLALNDMYDAAVASCKDHEDPPWIPIQSEDGVNLKLPQLFAMRPNGQGIPFVKQAVADYFENCGVKQGLTVREGLREHGLRYLAWRYAVNCKKNGFEQLPSVVRAVRLDHAGLVHYRKGQALFDKQVALLKTSYRLGDDWNGNTEARNGFSAHASTILQQMQVTPVPYQVASFFDDWVHDSFAGFAAAFSGPQPTWAKLAFGSVQHMVAEAQCYIRWRGLYCGGNDQLNAELDPATANQGMVAA
jgi:hypothetical protein